MRVHRLPAVALASVVSFSAMAAPVTYEFSGTMNGGSGGSWPIWYDFNIPVGTAFAGTFTVETETVPSFQSAEAVIYRDVLTGASIFIGPDGANGSYVLGGLLGGNYQSQILMIDDSTFGGNPPYDQFNLGGGLSPVPGDAVDLHRSFGFSAWSYSGQFFVSGFPTLDTMFDNVGPANPLLFTFSVSSHDETGEEIGAYLQSNVTDLRVVTASVPEPATLSLLGAGLLGALAARRRKRPAA